MSKQKKIMLLGGIHYLLPVIKAAHEQGYYVITADNIPGNIAHKYSDEFCNVSIVDKDAVLLEAQKHNIDGIISFGVDPGVVSAAYVQEQMHLPQMGPYESVRILQNKDLFRAFLQEHGFNAPLSRGYANKEAALNDTDWLQWPMIVKPTDSAGSKGVTRVNRIEEYEAAVDYAFSKSISGHIIVEEFIDKVGCSSDTDSFLLNGELKFVSFNAQRFDANAANPYTPAAYSWPSTFTEHEAYLTSELQRLLTLLKMNTSVFNIETRIASNGKPYIMECTPRGGGNRLCEMLRYATGVDLITAQVRAAVGDDVTGIEQKPYNGCWAEIILHAGKDGIFQGLGIADSLPARIVEKDLWVKEGDSVNAFNGANDAIGTLVLQFDNNSDLEQALLTQNEWLTINVK
ncbi:MAG: ATP-grasp domain-containing protein [Paludibacteraceae bacterium]|nr:ATP-grasp domain-containing protein [Paludibacteraceae bacterium]